MPFGKVGIQGDDGFKRLDLVVEPILTTGLEAGLDLLNNSWLKVGSLRRCSRKGCSKD